MLRNFGPEMDKQLFRLHDQIQRQNVSGAASVLHAIKGSAGTMGAKALSLLAGSLEHKLLHGDAATAASILTDSTCADELSALLQASVEQLNVEFGQSPRGKASADSEIMALTQWRESLKEILLLLETGNLQAIEQADALASKTPPSLRPQFDELVVMVQSLDFSAAMPIGRELLRSA